jgi:hypothetical protein
MVGAANALAGRVAAATPVAAMEMMLEILFSARDNPCGRPEP